MLNGESPLTVEEIYKCHPKQEVTRPHNRSKCEIIDEAEVFSEIDHGIWISVINSIDNVCAEGHKGFEEEQTQRPRYHDFIQTCETCVLLLLFTTVEVIKGATLKEV